MILICNNFSSIAQLFQLISLAQVQKKQGLRPIGRSSGGLTTKINSAVDGRGNPLGSILTAGQDSDIIQGLNPEMVIADQAYEANDLIQK
ncbi:MAG: hypothetical protein QGI86_25870 [Candidatus Poribacteria bacterium]|jgi:hypothetical protein|nr:hypothetical protein [Candidatus Poribacteria bacterium]